MQRLSQLAGLQITKGQSDRRDKTRVEVRGKRVSSMEGGRGKMDISSERVGCDKALKMR